MNMLLSLFVIGLLAVHGQENSRANMPNSLLECYNDTKLLDKNNRLPQDIPTLIAIIRKIEDHPNLDMNLRTLSVALLQRFRQDGIVQNPTVTAQNGVTPYAPTDFQFHRQAKVLQLIPGNAMAFPNNSISNVERCSLHAMVSNSIEILQRGDESTTCRRLGRFAKRSVPESSDIVEDVETLTDEQLKTMKNKDEPKDSGMDPNWFYPALPPNHPDFARVSSLPPISDCPVEKGVLDTEWGTVSGGSVLAGIAAGLEPQIINLGMLLKKEWQSSNELARTTLDNKWIATLAGDLAEVALRQGPLADEPLKIGVGGYWNGTLPRWYFLDANDSLFLTAAEIRGDLDGLILATEIANWYRQVPSLKLSQILDMYYSDRGVFNASIRACNRKNLLTSVAPNATITEQAYRSALVLSPGLATVTINPETIKKFVIQATNTLLEFIPSSMNDPTCGSVDEQRQFNSISTDITIFLDTDWEFNIIQPILVTLLNQLDISKYNSNFTLMNARDGSVMIESSNSILDFHAFNGTQYSNVSKGFDLAKTFKTINEIQTKKLDEEKKRGFGGRNSEVVLIIPHTSSLSETDKDYCEEQVSKLREDAPDVNIKFLTYRSKDPWSSLVNDPSTDIFPLSESQDFSAAVNGLLTSIRRVPKRLINSQCGSHYSRSGISGSFDDYLEPSGINFYRLHPNYFYGTDNTATVKIRASGSASLTVCSAREPVFMNSTTYKSCETLSSTTHTVTVSCGEASHIRDCSPLYLSVAVNSSRDGINLCTDTRFCRYSDMVKFTISYENLECVSSASSIILSPIILLVIVFYSYMH